MAVRGDLAGHGDLGTGAVGDVETVGGGACCGKVGDFLDLEKVKGGGRGGRREEDGGKHEEGIAEVHRDEGDLSVSKLWWRDVPAELVRWRKVGGVVCLLPSCSGVVVIPQCCHSAPPTTAFDRLAFRPIAVLGDFELLGRQPPNPDRIRRKTWKTNNTIC